MAKKIFNNMTAAERREVRKQARINKREAKVVPEPRFVPKSNRQVQQDVVKREERFVQNNLDRAPVKTPEQEAAEIANGEQSFEEMFLSIVQFLPPEDQSRAYSLFSTFRKLPKEEQKTMVDSLMNVARQNAGPLYDLYEKRIKEDATYNMEALKRQMNNAQANYDRLISTIDTNVIREKAKTDRSMAETIRNITNTAFVDRVAGSGIQRRRTREELERARLDKEDADVKANQGRGVAGAQFSQLQGNLQSQLDRQDVLQERDLYDNSQEEMEKERSLFLQLFENQMSGAGDNARDNIPTGDIPDAEVGKTRADVFAEGGTDAQRRARTTEEKRVANSVAEERRMSAAQQNINLAIDRIFDLNNYRASLRLANRDTSAIDAEIERLRPVAQAQIERARRGEGTFMRQVGSGLPDLDGFLGKASEDYAVDTKLIGRYGSAGLDRERLATELQRYSTLYNPDTLGKDFIGLDKEVLTYAPGTNKLINQFGSTGFNQEYAPPVRNGDVLDPTKPVVAPARATIVPPVAPTKKQAPVVKPVNTYPAVDLKNRTYTGAKPSFRRR